MKTALGRFAESGSRPLREGFRGEALCCARLASVALSLGQSARRPRTAARRREAMRLRGGAPAAHRRTERRADGDFKGWCFMGKWLDRLATLRAYRLSAAEADEAHAEPWDDAAIARFVARVALLMRRGYSVGDADDLAERLHLAGRPGAWRCGNHRAAGIGRELPAALVTRPQRCPGFEGAAL